MGRRIKVKLQDSTPARVIFLDEKATEGATLGTNLFTPDGLVGTPTTVRAWLGIGPSGETVVVNSGTIHHHLLQGLTEGNDHPQYPLKAGTETISGQWNFTQQVRAAVGSAAAPSYSWETDRDNGMYLAAEDTIGFAAGGVMRATLSETLLYQVVPQQIDNPVGVTDPQQPSTTQYAGLFVLNPDVTYQGGVEITTLTDPLVDPELNGVGSQIAFWEMKNFYGFRVRNDGQVDNDGDLNWYRHANSNDGVLFLKFTRDSNQIQFHPGSSSAPIITTFGDLNSGIYWPAADQIGFAVGGANIVTMSNANMTGSIRWRGPGGSAALPGVSFDLDVDTGMFDDTGNQLAFSTGGTERLRIVSSTAFIATLPWRGQDGSGAAPAQSYSGDTDTGTFRVGADQWGVSAGGTLRLTVSTTALTPTVPVLAPAGSAGAPSLSFSIDPDTGVFRVTDNTIGVATGGTERLRIDADGAWGLAGANYGTADQVLTSQGAGLPPIWADGGGGGGGGGSLVYVNTAAGGTVTNTASETAFTAAYTIPANTLTDGSVVRVRVFGTYGVDVVPPTLRLRLKLDANTVLDSGAVQTVDVDGGWMLEALLVARTGGATGALDAQGWMELETATNTGQVVNLENSSTFSTDMTQALDVTLTAQWSGADNDNTITLRQMAIWIDEAAVSPEAAAPAAATFLTEVDETATLPNSRALLAGTGITLDDSVGGELTISAASGSPQLVESSHLIAPGFEFTTGIANSGTVVHTGFDEHPGVYQLGTATSSNAEARVIRGNSVTAGVAPIIIGAGTHEMECLIRIPTLSTSAQTFFARFGFCDELAGLPSNGIMVQAAFDGSGNAIWQFFPRAAGATGTVVDGTANPPLANTWHKCKIVIFSTSSAKLYVDDVEQCEITSGFPSLGFSYGFNIQKTVGNTARSFEIDWVTYRFTPP